MTPSRSRTSGASWSSRATVSARQPTTSGPSTGCARPASAGSFSDQHAQVHEQAAVAVLGQAGQAVDVGHLDARRLQRLDQRIGSATGESLCSGTKPSVASRADAVRQQSPSGTPPRLRRPGQIGPSASSSTSRIGAAARQPARRCRQAAGPWLSKQRSRAGPPRVAQPAQQRRAALEAHQRVVAGDLEACGQRRRRQRAQRQRRRRAADRPDRRRSAPDSKSRSEATPRPFGAAQHRAGRRVAVAPGRAGARRPAAPR